MVDYGDTDREVKCAGLVWQIENVGDDSGVGLVRRSDFGQVERPIATNNEDRRVHREVFAVAASYIESYSARLKSL